MDLGLQQVAENALQQGILQVRGSRDPAIKDKVQNFAGTGGSAIVLNAKDGSVLALASNPTYPIDQFTNGIPADQFQTYTSPTSGFPLLDRATQGLYPPGSTFKLMTAIAAIQDGIAAPSLTLNDAGCFTFAARQFCNASKTKHGVVDMAHAIEVSSDLYFYNIGFFFWNEFHCGNLNCPQNSTAPGNAVKGYGIQNTAKTYGFGRASGIGLPQEAAGRIPDQAFKEAINKNSNDTFSKQWVIGDSANVATGQGDVLVTPLQLADAYAAFANGGTLYQPRLATQVLAPGDKTALRQLPSQVVDKTGLKPETRAAIMPGLSGAVSASDGTATAAFNGYKGIPIVGKTGTAQQTAPNEDTAWFAAIVNPDPTDPNQAQYVVVVNVEQAGFGGTVAAPIARRIIEALNGNGTPAPVQISPPQTD
jgi:penicillin-binding protein 2